MSFRFYRELSGDIKTGLILRAAHLPDKISGGGKCLSSARQREQMMRPLWRTGMDEGTYIQTKENIDWKKSQFFWKTIIYLVIIILWIVGRVPLRSKKYADHTAGFGPALGQLWPPVRIGDWIDVVFFQTASNWHRYDQPLLTGSVTSLISLMIAI